MDTTYRMVGRLPGRYILRPDIYSRWCPAPRSNVQPRLQPIFHRRSLLTGTHDHNDRPHKTYFQDGDPFGAAPKDTRPKRTNPMLIFGSVVCGAFIMYTVIAVQVIALAKMDPELNGLMNAMRERLRQLAEEKKAKAEKVKEEKRKKGD